MDLSQQDNLRLNVMLRQKLRAVRINESEMNVYALSDKGEIKVSLSPTCGHEKYLRWVREMLSTYVLGTPGGYPIYLKRWTRMGQMRDESLQGLLLLGEPEAVIAVAHAPGLTEEIAKDAWWIMPSSEVARKMLENEKVARSEIARELAAFIIEFLPFESDSFAIVESVRMILQPGLVSDEVRESLWRKANRKSAIYVGFLLAIPDNLPEKQSAHPQLSSLQKAQQVSDNWYTTQLHRCHGAAGQTFWITVEKTIAKLNSPDVAIALFNALDTYFYDRPWNNGADIRTLEQWQQMIDKQLHHCATVWPQGIENYQVKLQAILSLATIGEHLLNPIFAQTDAVGSVMRKKLSHITDNILSAISTLKT
jgi:hypothetical protein